MSIHNLLIDRMIEHLSAEMIDAVDDPNTKVGLLRSGKLQSDPTVNKLNILVREGGEKYPDVIAPANHPLYQGRSAWLGGGRVYVRRFVIEYELFFIGVTDRNEARTRANIITDRLHNAFDTMSLSGLTSEYDETPVAKQVAKLSEREGGGPPGSFIWRADHVVEFLTVRG